MGEREPETSRLLQRWHAGEREALDRLLERHLPAIREHVHRRLGPVLRREGDTGDFVHEAVVQVLRYGPRFVVSGEEHFRLLLARIVENVLRDEHDFYTARRRDRARESPLPTDSVLQLDPAARPVSTPSEIAARHEREAWVRLGLELLDPEDREVLVLHGWDDLPFGEIARRLGIAEGTARMRHHRALLRLAANVAALRRGEVPSEPA